MFDDIGEGFAPSAALLQQSHAAVIAGNVGHENPKLLAVRQKDVHHLRAPFPEDERGALDVIETGTKGVQGHVLSKCELLHSRYISSFT